MTARVQDARAGLAALLAEAEEARRRRAESDGGGRRLGGVRLEPLREHPDVLQLEQPAPLTRRSAATEPHARHDARVGSVAVMNGMRD